MVKQRLPKNTEKYHWTNHVFQKMRYYSLSESRTKRVLRHPERVEDGIAPGTAACMKRNDTKKKKEEIWVMIQRKKEKGKSKIGNAQGKIIIISAWRYPGVSPIGKKIEIPLDTLEFLRREGF